MRVGRLCAWLVALAAAAIVTAACGSGSAALHPTAPTAAPGSSGLSLDEAADVAAVASTAEAFDALGRGGNGGRPDHAGDHERGNGQEKDKDRDSAGADDDGDEGEGEDDDDDHDGPGRPDRRQLSGFVTAVGTDTIVIRGTTVRITTDTVIRHGHRRLTIADIEVGDHAQARGTYDGAVLVATEVKVEDTGRDNDDEEEVELKGVVAGLTPSPGCPSVTFTIGTTTVKTNSSTEFDDVACTALANGNNVEVEGVRQTDGSVLAKKVELESGSDEVEGRVAGLSGTCPAVTFTIGATTVTTSSSTTYEGVTCATLANNLKVEVEGTRTGSTLAAAKVELDD